MSNTRNIQADTVTTSTGNVSTLQASSGTIAFLSNILTTLLTGLSIATSTPVLSTDTIFSAIGKLQAQINNLSNPDIHKNINLSSLVSYNITPPTVLSGMTINTLQTGKHLILLNSQYSSTASSTTAQASADILATYNYLRSLPATVTTHIPAFGIETLTAGVYEIIGAGSITTATTLTLDGQGNPNALFVFRFGGAFSTGANAHVNLINGASANNVFWIADGAGSIGASTLLKGTIICTAAIDIGSGSAVIGRVTSTGGALSCTVATLTKPSGSSVVNLGVVDGFVMFTSSGAIANTGNSTVTGDIGTNLGAITGFETSVVNGGYYTATSISSVIGFGVYKNNVLIPNSNRAITRYTNVASDILSLQTPVTVILGDTIDIRVTVSSGTFTTGNRSLDTLKVG